jgi:recombination protein RecT
MTQTIGNAVAKQEEQKALDPRSLVRQYSDELAVTLPSHVKSESWLRGAAAALRRGKVDGRTGEYELVVAARNNPQAFIQALRHAAALGLRPGSEQYWLTPRKVAGRLEILGIVGYQGYIELMYNAGAVASIVVETVHANDRFEFVLGRDEYPRHEIDWMSDDRGELKLVYAYARMVNGATSKVVVLNRGDIERIKASAQGAKSEYSPWQTNERAMWLKSAVRQLQKWVPTSVEMLERRQRALNDAHGAGIVIPDVPAPTPPPPGTGDGLRLQHPDPDEVVDAEIVPDESAPPAAEEPAPEETPATEQPPVEAPAQPQSKPARGRQPAPAKSAAVALGKLFTQKGFKDDADRHEFTRASLETPNLRMDDALTAEQVQTLIGHLNELSDVTQ